MTTDSTTTHPRSKLLTFSVVLNAPLTAFACLLIWQQFSPERTISHIELGAFKPLAWFAPLEEFFGGHFEKPQSFIPPALVAVLYFATFLLGFCRRAAYRPQKRVLLLHIELGLMLGVVLVCSMELIGLWFGWLIILVITAAYTGIAWAAERLLSIALNKICELFFEKGNYAVGNYFLNFALLLRPSDRKLMRMLGVTRFETENIRGAIDALEPLAGCIDLEALTILEDCYRREKVWDKALRTGKMLVAVEPENEDVRVRVARLLVEQSQFGEAADLLRSGPSSSRMDHLGLQLECELKLRDFARAQETAQRIENVETRGYSHTETAWRNILQLDPSQKQALESLARLLVRHNREEEVYDLYEKMIELNPQQYDLRLNLIQHYKDVNQLDKAEPHLLALMDMGRANEDIVLMYGNNLFQRGEYDRALLHFHYAVESYPDDYRFAYFLAQISFKTDALEEAKRWCIEAESHIKEPHQLERIQSLRARIDKGVEDRELQVLQERSRRNPQDIDARLQVLVSLCIQNKGERAVAEFDEFLTTHPQMRQRAMDELKRFTAGDDANFRLMDYVADLHLKDERWDDVFDLACRLSERSLQGEAVLKSRCEQILAVAPEHLRALHCLANISHKSQDWEKSLELHERLLKMKDTEREKQLQAVFEAQRELGHTDKAMEVGQALINEHPRDIHRRMQVVYLLAEQDRYDEAFVHLTAAQSMDYYNAEVIKAIQELGERRKAARLKSLLSEIDQNPNNMNTVIEVGDIYADFGEMRKAISYYQKAVHAPAFKNRAGGKLAYAMAQMHMFDLAEETLNEVELRSSDPVEEAQNKGICYEVAEMFRQEELDEKALHLFKKIFRVDAAYRDVVEKMESLQQ